VTAGVALTPLTGYYDQERAAHIRPSLLEGIDAAHVRVLLVDLAGVSEVSDALVDHLARAVRSIALMGCEVVLTGVGSDAAWSLAQRSADLGRLPSRRNVSEALAYAQAWLGGEREAIG
jgi:rsbT co-antagonist protein RsbR